MLCCHSPILKVFYQCLSFLISSQPLTAQLALSDIILHMCHLHPTQVELVSLSSLLWDLAAPASPTLFLLSL